MEQAGKGASENWTPFTSDPERAPAELPYRILYLVQVNLSASNLSLATLPSLFDTLWRPNLR